MTPVQSAEQLAGEAGEAGEGKTRKSVVGGGGSSHYVHVHVQE